MYRFPADLDLRSIVGLDLTLMGLGANDLQLNFTSSENWVRIFVWSAASLLSGTGKLAEWLPGQGWSDLNFQKLVNATVADFSVIDKTTLHILFTNGLIIALFDMSDQFDSIEIVFKDGREIII